MFAVLTCIVVQHDLRLVVLAALICVTASGTAFGFHLRSLKTAGNFRSAWTAMTGLVAGSGVWATHFIAMLAYQPNLQIRYAFADTAVSLGVAVLGMAAGFGIAASRPGRATGLIGGAVTGLSIGAMHFMGMAAVRTQAHLTLDAGYVTAALLVGAIGGMGAFSARFRIKGAWGWTLPCGILVLGIVGLHFTAMAAVALIPDAALAVPREVMDRGTLVAATGGLAALILGSALALIWVERLAQHNTLSSLRHALNAVPAGLAFFNSADRLSLRNEAFAALMAELGVEAETGAPRSRFLKAAAAAGWFESVDPSHVPDVDVIESFIPDEPREFQLADGRWLRHEGFRTQDGGRVTVLTDVSAQRRSAEAMAAARDSAEAANRAKTEFLANMSHEIRTPLNGVLGIADLLTRTRLSRQQRDLVGVIQESGDLLNGLLTELLDLARIEAGMAELRTERVRPAALAEQVRKLFAARAEQKGLSLVLEVGPGAESPVECDPLRLRQVLGNLLSNAIKFTEAGGVALSLVRDDNALRFEVRDTGVGFDTAQKDELFQRFGRADGSATRQHGGAGLGLAICSQYVALLGGQLDCDSRLGQGSAFRFTLNLPSLAVRPARRSARAVAGAHVLVVDDNAVNRKILELILANAGLDYASVEDGRQAVQAMMTGRFDAALMDIQMPVMDGLEATRQIRAWEADTGGRRSPILIVSANCMKEHVDAGRAAGADGHLNKPVVVADLIALLQQRLAEAAELQAQSEAARPPRRRVRSGSAG